MSYLFFFSPWLESWAGTSFTGYIAWIFDSYALTVVMLLLIWLLSWIPKEGITLFLAAVVYTVLIWVHFDAAYWRSTLPSEATDIVLATIVSIVVPTLSFVVTRWAWKARHE